ncbi:MAG: hypothetical protein ACFFED_17745 [Candidatus Thorarchaeota archaeon]
MGRGKSLKDEFMDAKMKRSYISAKLPKLTYEQVDLLHNMVKRWLKEEEMTGARTG